MCEEQKSQVGRDLYQAPLSTPLAQPGPAAAPDAGGHFASPQVTEHRMHILSGATPAPSPQKSVWHLARS